MRRPAKRAAPLRRLLAVCPGCLQPRRPFASAGPPPSGFAALPQRRLLSVSGPDAAKFLQGLITANIVGPDGLPRADAFYTGFLNATGRVVHEAFVYPFRPGCAVPDHGGGFLVEADAAQVAGLARYIKRYKLRAKVYVRDLSDGPVTVWQAWDDAAAALNPAAGESQIVKDPRAPNMGFRILRLDDRPPDLALEQSSEESYKVRRYLQGIPEGQDEIIREQALPLETNMDVMSAIDFRKGCYVGQELTIRTKHRGVVRKRILPCMTYAEDEAAPGALAYTPRRESPTADAIPGETSIGRVGKKGRSAGKWLKGVGNIGLGLCRLEIMTDLVLPGEQTTATYDPGDEFVAAWGQDKDARSVRVKAFVPDWLRASLAQPSG